MAQLISVKLSRFDGSPWGFRLQGGKDFGTPLVVQKSAVQSHRVRGEDENTILEVSVETGARIAVRNWVPVGGSDLDTLVIQVSRGEGTTGKADWLHTVNSGSPAEAAGLKAGDSVIRVNSTEVYNLRHKDAQDVIVRGGNNFEMTIQRGGGAWKPHVSPLSSTLPSPSPTSMGNITPVTKTSLAAKKQDGSHIGSGHNFSPKPFLNGTGDGPIKSIVNKQYNSPVGIYSEETIAETLSAQAEVLAGGVLGVNFKKNEKNYNAENSEVFKMVQEADKEPKTPEPAEPTAQSGVITPSSPALAGLRPVSAPETKQQQQYQPPQQQQQQQQQQQPSTPQSSLPPGQNICAECERLIVTEFYSSVSHAVGGRATSPRSPTPLFHALHGNGPVFNSNENSWKRPPQRQESSSSSSPSSGTSIVRCSNCDRVIVGVFVRIKEKNLHVECFKCSTCGTSLKNVGYYNINNKLYCDIHAKLVARQNAPAGMVPITVPPGGKAPASTISAALANAPLSPPLSNHASSPLPFSACNRSSPDYGSPNLQVSSPNRNGCITNGECHWESKTFTSTITIQTGCTEPTRLGTSPVDPPSFRSVQAPASNNLIGPKPFGGSSNLSSNLSSPPLVNTGNSTLPRPQSQTVTEDSTETYEKSYYYEHVEETKTECRPSSVKSKSLAWPPAKPIEEVTYPTASPLYIDPNPTLDRRGQQAVKEKKACIEACERALTKKRAESTGVGGLGGAGSKSGTFAGSSAPKRGRGILNQASGPGSRVPLCAHCNSYVRGPFITALGQIWCPEHFVCVNTQCRRPLQDIGFVEEKGQLYCEYCFERFIAPNCNKCNNKIKGDCLNAIGKHFHPECFKCSYCGKLFGNSPFFLEEGLPYCEADWNELFTTKCFACGFPVEAGDRWVEALNNNYHSQCFNCTMCKKNLEGQSFYAKGGRPFCKNHAR
ncbi:PDZ and LIM domain protein Zasp [Dufourea novaeangliae]|uniref:PDZ and LIM domain protein Zasp n=1 Tax=Dufourea novaeangliae TaxID=178035 RepID=A0A154PS34_DUFNO|nr:PDZ and LIM domain protein Zasp [Dufourea novaeangliae]